MKKEDIEKQALQRYFHTELWENFTHIVVDTSNHILGAFYNEYDAGEFVENNRGERLFIVELDYEKVLEYDNE